MCMSPGHVSKPDFPWPWLRTCSAINHEQSMPLLGWCVEQMFRIQSEKAGKGKKQDAMISSPS